eukprot:6390175-Pyramimonas_sp.AAC.1
MASGCKMDYHPQKAIKKDRLSIAGDLTIFDLPIIPISRGSSTKLVAFADVISSYEGALNFAQIHEFCCQGRCKDLQAPL